MLISYIDTLYPTEDRNNRLRESYYFTCHCQECDSRSMVRRPNYSPVKSPEPFLSDVRPTPCLTSNLQDEAKLKPRKRSDPIEPEVISNMVRYARKCIREFRAFKTTNDILHVGRTTVGSGFSSLSALTLP